MIVSDANDCTIASDCKAVCNCGKGVFFNDIRGLGKTVAAIAGFCVLSLSLALNTLSRIPLTSLSLWNLYNHAIDKGKLLKEKKKDTLSGLHPFCNLQSLFFGARIDSGRRARRPALRWFPTRPIALEAPNHAGVRMFQTVNWFTSSEALPCHTTVSINGAKRNETSPSNRITRPRSLACGEARKSRMG